MPGLRIVFMGTAELACASLEALARSAAAEVAGVITQPDKPRGRDLRMQPPPLKEAALHLGLAVLQPERLRAPEGIQQVADLRPDLVVVVAYGQLLPPAVLALPRHGCLNVHASLLPKYRGAAPIQWALWNGDPETGVTVMRMEAGLDTGPIVSQERLAIGSDDNARSLHDRLARQGADLLARTIPEYVAGRIPLQPQDPAQATHARKIVAADGRIDWTQPARRIWNQVRALTPWPGAFTELPETTPPIRLKVSRAEVAVECRGAPGEIQVGPGHRDLLVACGEEGIRLLEVQREGRRPMKASEFLAGWRFEPGSRFPA